MPALSCFSIASCRSACVFASQESLLAKRKIRVHVLDGRARFAHEVAVLGQDVVLALQSDRAPAGTRRCRHSHQGQSHEHLLQLDLAGAGEPLADAKRLLPRSLRFGVAALTLVDPGVGDVNVGELQRLAAVLSLEDRLRESQQRLGFGESIL